MNCRASHLKAPLAVIVGLGAAGVMVGVAWVLVAPPVHGAIALTRSGRRVHVYLGEEADHFFVSAVMVAGMLTAVAVAAAVLVWQWRSQRGPWVAAALIPGGLASAGAATGVGALLARLRYGAIDVAAAPISPEHRVHYVVEAPTVYFGHTPLHAMVTLLIPAAAAALAYAVLAVSAEDDLGVSAVVEPADAVAGRS